jgi:hypothetical protein
VVLCTFIRRWQKKASSSLHVSHDKEEHVRGHLRALQLLGGHLLSAQRVKEGVARGLGIDALEENFNLLLLTNVHLPTLLSTAALLGAAGGALGRGLVVTLVGEHREMGKGLSAVYIVVGEKDACKSMASLIKSQTPRTQLGERGNARIPTAGRTIPTPSIRRRSTEWCHPRRGEIWSCM